MWLVNPEQTLSAARRAGLADDALRLSDVAVLTFNKAIVDRIGELCGLEDITWIGPRHHPYAAAELVKHGTYRGLGVTLIVPPMGASPLACVVEDLIACGVRGVFLACAAWSLGPPVRFGDVIVPAFSIGPDGTSIHYGNTTGRAEANPAIVDVLADCCRRLGATVHVGGNASCEAIYRITPQMQESYRKLGCLCMENGEASVLLSLARGFAIPAGVLFQPYIELSKGWDPSCLNEAYQATCRVQAEAVLDACIRLRQLGIVQSSQSAGHAATER
jgi:uridine phosphorylase